MITLLATIALTPVGPGTIDVDGLAPSAQLLVEGRECRAEATGNRITGDPGCVVSIAIVEADGSITRVVGQLPAPAPRPAAPPAAPPPAPPVASVAVPPASMPASASTPTKSGTPSSVSGYGLEAGVFRGLADFGFTGATLGLTKRALPWLDIKVAWLHGTGRADTPAIPDQLEHIEEELDLVQGMVVARHQADPSLALIAGVGGFAGLLRADEVSTATTTLSSASQALSGVLVNAGVEAAAGRARLNVAWNAYWAGGEWYPADDYGSGVTGPPARFDLLSHGISVTVGIEL